MNSGVPPLSVRVITGFPEYSDSTVQRSSKSPAERAEEHGQSAGIVVCDLFVIRGSYNLHFPGEAMPFDEMAKRALVPTLSSDETFGPRLDQGHRLDEQGLAFERIQTPWAKDVVAVLAAAEALPAGYGRI